MSLKLKHQLFLVSALSLLVIGAILTTLFITTTPRANEYFIAQSDSTTDSELLEQFSYQNIKKCTWYDILYEFSIIRTDEDLDSDSGSITFFTQIDMNTPITSLTHIGPPYTQSQREYVDFQNSSEVHRFHFTESAEPAVEYMIYAKTLNLRNRQTAVCAFYMEDGEMKGYVLNNVLLRARETVEISLQLEEEKNFVTILDFDGNQTNFPASE
ncbi:hypothetical protein NEMIN01_0487 [Nematocida minor]|uniref:uncharacterized protein n=1 Tax=Nematocida minor TaxID=1912983 RepID=UPI00222061BF|nr:uncharacterized protein NEMIN01_0487 [Nematocida minor]KAI5189424.1 hypothetical protein NEMIN01_0487 [Nematocida minor]